MMKAQYAVIEAAQESSTRRRSGLVTTARNASIDSPSRSRKEPSIAEQLQGLRRETRAGRPIDLLARKEGRFRERRPSSGRHSGAMRHAARGETVSEDREQNINEDREANTGDVEGHSLPGAHVGANTGEPTDAHVGANTGEPDVEGHALIGANTGEPTDAHVGANTGEPTDAHVG